MSLAVHWLDLDAGAADMDAVSLGEREAHAEAWRVAADEALANDCSWLSADPTSARARNEIRFQTR